MLLQLDIFLADPGPRVLFDFRLFLVERALCVCVCICGVVFISGPAPPPLSPRVGDLSLWMATDAYATELDIGARRRRRSCCCHQALTFGTCWTGMRPLVDLAVVVCVLCLWSGPIRVVSGSAFVLNVPPLKSSSGGSNNHGSGMRPSPSYDLPVVDLIEPPDQMYDPKVDDLDNDQLVARLGRNYDPWFMSIDPPKSSSNDTRIAGLGGAGTIPERRRLFAGSGKMPEEIRKLKPKLIILPNGRPMKTKMSRKFRRKLRQFLWAYTYCPVSYSWKDLGVRFWPRWLREGQCRSGKSCSFPQGMVCKASKSVNKVLLRWYCQDWEQPKYCRWIPIRYPVITGCSCSC